MVRKTFNKLLGIRLLAFLSPLLLVLFLVRWLDSQYEYEKMQLTRELSRRYHESGSAVSDVAMFDQLIEPVLEKNGIPNPHVEIKTWVDTGKGVKFFQQERELNIPGKTGRGDHGVSSNVKIIRINSTKNEDSLLKRMVKVLVDKTSLGHHSPIHINDTALQQHFAKALADAGYRFHLNWTQIAREGIYIGPGPLFPEISGVFVTGYQTYILKRLLPEILFALFLLAVTCSAIIVIYRSMKTQQKLGLMRNDLISNMTHELKTPIATVKVALEVLEHFEVKDPATIKEFLGMAVLEMNRLELLVNQALNTSLLESGEMQIIPAREDIYLLTVQIMQALQPGIEQAKSKLVIEKTGDYFLSDIDKLHYQGVIINLVDNALKYGGKSPVIHIAIKEEERKIVVRISDNGPGIPAQYLGKVFDKFFRVPSGNVHNNRGYGLGLSYAKKVTERHSGTLEAQNNPGGGCSFTITLLKAIV